jgi:pimeloyl-ACP methyl ester carboxylesterase
MVMAKIRTQDGTQLYFKDWGTGRPVVLIHGWPLSADSWDDQAMALAEAGYRVVAYDRRGFGRSEQPWSGYDYDTLADDLASVLENRGLTDVTLVGFSMGGGEVARYMSRHQGRHVAQAVLISSVVPRLMKAADNPNGVEPKVFEQMAEGLRSDRAKFLADFFEDFYGMGLISHPVSREHVAWSTAVALQASLKATLDCAQAFAMTDFRSDLAAFEVPTLIVHGTSDQTVPIDSTGRAAARLIAGAELIEYGGAPTGSLPPTSPA